MALGKKEYLQDFVLAYGMKKNVPFSCVYLSILSACVFVFVNYGFVFHFVCIFATLVLVFSLEVPLNLVISLNLLKSNVKFCLL